MEAVLGKTAGTGRARRLFSGLRSLALGLWADADSRVLLVTALATLVGLVALTWDLRPTPMMGWVDDYKYVSQAQSLLHLKWLGPYTSWTLIKRPGFQFFLALTSMLQLPYLPVMTLLFLACLGVALYACRKAGLPRWAVAACFVVCAFLPSNYNLDATRVLRNRFSQSLDLLLFGLALLLAMKGPAPLGKSRLFRVFCLLAAWHWATREEAFLLWPSLIALGGWAVFVSRSVPFLSRLVWLGKAVSGVGVSILVVYLGLCSLNWMKYGVFLMDENSEGAFPRAMGALASIEESGFDRYLVNRRERAKLRELSPTFAAIGGILDRAPDESEACRRDRRCDGPDYSHSIYYLRSTPDHAKLGTFSSAGRAQEVFEGLRREVIAICREGKLRCLDPESRSIRPPFRKEHWPYLIEAVPARLSHLVRLSAESFSVDGYKKNEDGLDDGRLSQFRKMTRQESFGTDGGKPVGSRPAPERTLLAQKARREAMARLYSAMAPWLLVMGALGWLIALARCRLGPSGWGAALGLAAFTFVVARVAAVSFISAVDAPMAPLYLVPAYPFVLILAFGGSLALARPSA